MDQRRATLRCDRHGERVTLALIEVAPNSLFREHTYGNEQLGILVRGSLRNRVGEETREFGSGGTWPIRGGVAREVDAGTRVRRRS